MLARTIDSQGLIPVFPTITIRAVKHALTIERFDACDIGHLINNPCCQDEFAGGQASAIIRNDFKVIGLMYCINYLDSAHLNVFI